MISTTARANDQTSFGGRELDASRKKLQVFRTFVALTTQLTLDCTYIIYIVENKQNFSFRSFRSLQQFPHCSMTIS